MLYLVQNGEQKNKEQIISGFQNWSQDKAERFSTKYITECIEYLEETGIVQTDIFGSFILTGKF